MLTARPPSLMSLARPPGDVEHTQLRLRLLDGLAQQDLREYIVRRVGALRAQAWGQPQRTTCALADLSAAVAVLYVQDPTVSHPGAAGTGPDAVTVAAQVADVVERLRISGLWQVAGEAQRLTEALNECAIHVEIDAGRIIWRLVTPDLLQGLPAPGRPGEPEVLAEWRPRHVVKPGGRSELMWLADLYDISDPAAPAFRVVDEDGVDRTRLVMSDVPDGGFVGAAYRWRYEPSTSHPAGRPFIPYSLRHAEAAPRALFSPWRRIETVDATMEACSLDTMTSHVCTQASFPLTYVSGGELITEQVVDPQGRPIARGPTLDPAAIQRVSSTEPGQQGKIEVVRNETDPLMLMDVSERLVARCASAWGLGPSDVQRTAADSRSGIALAVSSEGRRRMQASRAPIYRPADERLVGMLCALLNRAGVGGIVDRPESGWQVSYTLSPLSPQERSQRQAEAEALFAKGAISRAEMRAMITGETTTQASAALAEIDRASGPSETAPPNGAQITALVDILAKIRTGEMSAAAAAVLIPITFPNVDPTVALSLATAQTTGQTPPPDQTPSTT
jgi:hypothetical protein